MSTQTSKSHRQIKIILFHCQPKVT